MSLEEYEVIETGRRLGVQWPAWMGDWFTSLSPRNCNNHAEGPWHEWVKLAVEILQHPFTAWMYPELHEQVQDWPTPPEDRLDEEAILKFLMPPTSGAGGDHAE